MLVWEVPESAAAVAARSRQVRINTAAVRRFCGLLLEQHTAVPPWDDRHHFTGPPEETCAYLLVLDTLNFCFWPPTGGERWEIRHHGETLGGYYALATTLKAAMEAGRPITDAGFLARLGRGDLMEILGGRGCLQLLEERVSALNELGRLLAGRYGGKAANLVRSAGGSALALVRRLAEELPSFRDTAVYHGTRVFFYKRAQIFAADLHGALAGRGLGAFTDVSYLTAFADYKLPQVLRQEGILVYASDLARRVDRRLPLAPGSPAEIEIRANTIAAVSSICRLSGDAGKPLTASQVDWLLWNMGQADGYRKRPYHRTLTMFY